MNGVIDMMNLIEILDWFKEIDPMYILYWFVGVTSLFSLTFLFYLAVIQLRDMKENDTIKDLHWTGQGLGYSFLYLGLIMDAVLNVVGLSVCMWEFPREFLCTARVIRHKYEGTGWRHDQALWWCSKWLTPVDKRHCEK